MSDTSQRRVFLAEDDDNDAYFLTWAFKKSGVEVIVDRVCDGVAAIEWLNSTTTLPDVIVTDLKMPCLVEGSTTPGRDSEFGFFFIRCAIGQGARVGAWGSGARFADLCQHGERG